MTGDQNMSEKEMQEAEKNNAESNIEVEPLSDQEMDSVAGGTFSDPAVSDICSAAWCS
jgi:hypothetical protein